MDFANKLGLYLSSIERVCDLELHTPFDKGLELDSMIMAQLSSTSSLKF